MRHTIKNYQLNENITLDALTKAKFEQGGWMKQIKSPKVRFFKILCDDVELHIEIPVGDIKNINFSEEENICVFDDECGERYIPFYRNNLETPFINKIIDNYNETMDDLVGKGIFKEKVKK